MDLNSKQFKVFGSFALVIVAFQIFRKVFPWIYLNIIGPKLFGPKINFTIGQWAVVTGATDGIGKAYAKALAKRGLKLVLISRSREKLQAVSKEISDEYVTEIKLIDVDFTDGPEIYKRIAEDIQELDIGVLVNNVGMSYPYPEYFLNCTKTNSNFLRDIISVNIHSVTHMCQLVMPAMLEKQKGVIINIASTSAVIPNPLLTVYSATKAFVDKFSADLNFEYQNKGIVIQSIRPGFVATNMTKIRQPNVYVPSPDTFVESALSTLGIAGQTAGYLRHSLLILAINTLASLFGDEFARNIIMKNMLATRKKALRHVTDKTK